MVTPGATIGIVTHVGRIALSFHNQDSRGGDTLRIHLGIPGVDQRPEAPISPRPANWAGG